MTARAEAFQPGHLTWRALASRRHWLYVHTYELAPNSAAARRRKSLASPPAEYGPRQPEK